jgi:hypothetical protein
MTTEFDVQANAISAAEPHERGEVYRQLVQGHVAQSSGVFLGALAMAQGCALACFYVAAAFRIVATMPVKAGTPETAHLERLRAHAAKAMPVIEGEMLPILGAMDPALATAEKIAQARAFCEALAKWAPRTIGPQPTLMGAEEVTIALAAFSVAEEATKERRAAEEKRPGGDRLGELAAVCVKINAALQGVAVQEVKPS